MRVGQSGNTPVQNGESASTKHAGHAAAAHEAKKGEAKAAVSAKDGGARAEISAKSKEFAQAKAIASQAPDIREDKVEDLKKRIADGSYHVDSDALAERMVDEHFKMRGTG